MFDFHMHSMVSDDCQAIPAEMLAAAERAGLTEICFTDHIDCAPGQFRESVFEIEDYERAYCGLKSGQVTIRLGMEYGIAPNSYDRFLVEKAKRDYDFIIGSVHVIEGAAIHKPEYWEGKTQEQVYTRYLQAILESLESGPWDFHVLGHLTHPSKVMGNPNRVPYTMEKYGDLAEEIFKHLITMGIGIEVNTSGIRWSGEPLPPLPFVKRYLEMGGEILTIGSDAHRPEQVGYQIRETLTQLKELTPWICTFAEGKPKFHRIEDLL